MRKRDEVPSFRITRARAKSLSQVLVTSAKENRHVSDQRNAKRASSDGKDVAVKKRAILKDVTNDVDETSEIDVQSCRILRNEKTEEMRSLVLEDDSWVYRDYGTSSPGEKEIGNGKSETSNVQKVKEIVIGKSETSNVQKVFHIDFNHLDPQMCSLYAPAIYNNLRVRELDRRPLFNYMEVIQKEINPNMRRVLVDWLVEVSDEYMLVPDTLYLTIDLIDRYLSRKSIGRLCFQLLGVTCMLIAMKFEELMAMQVKEFCSITADTYTKEEVLEMELEVLYHVGYQLCVPTTKVFLRRFIQAAQVLYKDPSVELEFLANYLAELSLIEYSFLKFIPSLIAASAVFLARWTLNQIDHPWNPTLEHYTGYKTSDLKVTVIALQEMQLNIDGQPLDAIYQKYKHPKFYCVSTLSSTKPVESLFKDEPETSNLIANH